jgi:hypothetical protein
MIRMEAVYARALAVSHPVTQLIKHAGSRADITTGCSYLEDQKGRGQQEVEQEHQAEYVVLLVPRILGDGQNTGVC